MDRKTIVLFVLGALFIIAAVVLLLYQKSELQRIIDGEIDPIFDQEMDSEPDPDIVEVEKQKTEPAKVSENER